MLTHHREHNTLYKQNPRPGKWLSEQRGPKPRHPKRFNKLKLSKATPIVRQAVMKRKHDNRQYVTVEAITNDTRIHPSIVKTCFMALNREGLLSQAINEKHTDFDWVATKYAIRN